MVELNSSITIGGINIFLDCRVHAPLKRYGRFKTVSGQFCRTIFHNPGGVPVNTEGLYDPDGEKHHIFIVGGWYNDVCIKTDNGWRIQEKIEEQAYMQGGYPPLQ